ncbi:MAG: purine-binding chemotaxis protein CheW [Bacteriovoracaceae bacterium]|jgi:purine-binding chemotaxis protein CheW|nr:purine-binding chemotaxis protein CheW [Bacteriovoracaceae bacterium]
MIEDEKSQEKGLGKKYLNFSIGERVYAVPLLKVKEVVSDFEITPVPKVPSWFRGLINLRGGILSIIDLNTKLNQKETDLSVKETCVVIFEIEEVVIGVLVDEVIKVSNYFPDQLSSGDVIKSSNSNKFIESVIKEEDGSLTFLLEVESALGIEELQILKEKLAS